MSPLDPLLGDDGVVLLDGGLATELEARGHALDGALWSARLLLDDPAAIEAVHDAYLTAGADVATAATYQASLAGLCARGLTVELAHDALRHAMTLARRACERAATTPGLARPRPLAAASLGAYGAHLADGSEYRGDYAVDDAALDAYHRERLQVLAPHADLVACETIPCLREAESLARVLAGSPTPAWVSFQCKDDAHVAHGEPIEACVAAVARVPAVVAVGVNCCAPWHVEGLVRRIRAACPLPIVAYPNAGERYADGRWCGERVEPDALAQLAARWHAAGARIIGGCCRTGPAHVAALHRWRQGLRGA